jgi:enediyne polyketide synthase
MSNASSAVAIVGLACIYPDARTPAELWENVLAQRRSFRRLPPERLRAEDYCSSKRNAPDQTYSVEGAVIEGYAFDRVAFRVVGSTFRSADLAHWLALDVASRALADAGFADGRGLPRESTGVLVGNTLTGEFSRAGLLRLRWPYVRRVMAAALEKEGWSQNSLSDFLERLEANYKSPFPAMGEESLAGGLSNTIAGRICNQFDLKGGGYTVDGACASSLLAVANACSALQAGDMDAALAGGVDLSLDPFELVGFAKAGALASDEMRVYDRRSAGFWPGEGCGFAVLMRHQDALAQGCRVYAVIRGWGVSSDGSGGITRPEAEGQLEALRRAYRRAGFKSDTVAYCEGHGTGTAVGDATELEVLSRVRREAGSTTKSAAVGSVKANIGHTKAAAGIAGLIKATMAVHTQVLPPTTGCEQAHSLLEGPAPALRVLRAPELWPRDRPLRASVSAMGFGGINAHVVLESVAAERRDALSSREQLLSRSNQDVELFLFAAATAAALSDQVEKASALAGSLSRAEMSDLAVVLAKTCEQGLLRAAVLASKPVELAERLQTLRSWLDGGFDEQFRSAEGVILGAAKRPPRLAFLFPGQGSPTYLDGGAWSRRFESVRQSYDEAELPSEGDASSTRVMQPAVIAASVAGLKVLENCGLTAAGAIGHSLGELTALHWAGVLSEEAVFRIARVRGAAMATLGKPTGAMLALAAPCQKVQPLLGIGPLKIVGFNSPKQTVVAGDAAAIRSLAERAAALGWDTTRLPVSHAFHTPLVAAAVPVLAEQLASENFARIERLVVSTITGKPLEDHEDLRERLTQQVTLPVQFQGALTCLLALGPDAEADPSSRRSTGKGYDLLIEVGPGQVLSGLARDITDVPVVALDAGGPSLKGLFEAVGTAFALGAPVRTAALYGDRFTRPISLDWKPKFFANPCELAPSTPGGAPAQTDRLAEPSGDLIIPTDSFGTKSGALNGEWEAGMPEGQALGRTTPDSALELVRHLVAERAELPSGAVLDDFRMLSDLHLNSISVSQLVSEAAKRLGVPRVLGLTDFANASVAEMACALEELKQSGNATRIEDQRREPPGVDIWTESFIVDLVEAPRPGFPIRPEVGQVPSAIRQGNWQAFAPPSHPFAPALRRRLEGSGGSGILVCVPAEPSDQVTLLLAAAKALSAMEGARCLVLVHHGTGGASFARTLHLETPGLTTCVVAVPPEHPKAMDWIAAEVASAEGYAEARYDQSGTRHEPRLTLVRDSAADDGAYPIGRGDVLLVTGGGKGIAAECALALGRATGAGLALLGRSDPQQDRELAENLARIAAAGVRCAYVRADVISARAVRAAVAQAEKELGPVTALLHGAGTNTPQLISALDEAAVQRTLAPKIQGLRNVLAALEPDRLRLLVTFGSIIARAGLRGEADYALANEWLTALTEQFQTRHPKCRCLALEWSVWSGVGMGERLGRVDSLILQGIMPIHPDEGVRILLERLRRPQPATALVITGRFGEAPTLKLAQPELPLLRFLERKRAHYPGVELIVDAQLSPQTDPFLDDHIVHKERLLPAVLGLEGMAQAAMALTGSRTPPSFEHVELTRPVAISSQGTTTIRLAALRRGPDLIEACLRSEATDYHVDHFRALCRFSTAPDHTGSHPRPCPAVSGRLPLDLEHDLYGQILFHRGRFRRLEGYQLLRAKECVAEIGPDDSTPWFGPYLPGEFLLGNPAARDAALHAIQACIPHRRILPTGIDRLVIHRIEAGPRTVWAKERSREGANFIYDLQVTNAGGMLLEEWEGLRLRAVEELPPPPRWPLPLLGPYLERRLEELVVGSAVGVAAEKHAPDERETASRAALQKSTGRVQRIFRRPDGKAVTSRQETLSAAHSRKLVLAISGAGGVACDIEEVVARAQPVWRGILGEDLMGLAKRVAEERGEDFNTAATRLWNAYECMKKAGLPPTAPLVLDSSTEDGWVLFRSGTLTVATCTASLAECEAPVGIGLALNQTGRATPALPLAQTAGIPQP